MKVLNIKETTGERFYGGSLPDIDLDFAGKDRAEIKAYMERRFGKKQVCSVGAYTTMQIKGIVKDFDRQYDNDFKRANLITKILDGSDGSLEEVVKKICSEEKLKKKEYIKVNKLKEYIKENPDIFYTIPDILDQPKTKSIHPCAVIVFPGVMTTEEWVPVRKQQGLIVSEWSGEEMDDAGFLKVDILGIKQLDKFDDILKLIKSNGKTVPDIYKLPKDDSEVYRYFSNGWNGDVFQFGSEGLTEYSRTLKPRSLHDVIAAVALYRPGPMENHYHEIYAKCKNKGRKPEFLWGTENITKDTYGLLVFQEQIMRICQEIGGLSLQDADSVRKALGKKKLDVLEKWKCKLEKGFIKKGATKEIFEKTWNVIVEFAKYSFNLSHSVAYGITAYISQYLKVHYPIEYWTIAFDYASEKQIPLFIAEIFQAKEIQVKPPNINKSKLKPYANQEDKTIYWGFTSIKGMGETSASQIEEEREQRGEYSSFNQFLKRNLFKGSKVNKKAVEALITAGAFDKIENISLPQYRFRLLEEYREKYEIKIDEKKDKFNDKNIEQYWWWLLKQKELTGLVFVDYSLLGNVEAEYTGNREINEKQQRGIFRTYGGYVTEVRERSGRKGRFAKITIESNYKMINIMVWSDEYKKFKKEVKSCLNSFILFSGELKYEDKWTKGNQFTLTEESKFEVFK